MYALFLLLSMFFAQWCIHILLQGAHTALCQASRPKPPFSSYFLSSAKKTQKKKQTTLFTKYSAGHVFLLVFFTSHNDPRRFTKTHKLNNAAMIAVQTLLV
uniref:Putative conserved secreted protein n=1 Tax=Rhipicephalus microplus TaxID=6941 RepID=A0A6G5A3N4_RHIMP